MFSEATQNVCLCGASMDKVLILRTMKEFVDSFEAYKIKHFSCEKELMEKLMTTDACSHYAKTIMSDQIKEGCDFLNADCDLYCSQ